MGFLKYIAQGAGWEVGRGLVQSVRAEASASENTETPIPSAAELAEQREKLEAQEALRAAIEKKKTEIKRVQRQQRAERELALLKQRLRR